MPRGDRRRAPARAPRARLRRRDRAVDAADAARDREPLLPRPRVPPAPLAGWRIDALRAARAGGPSGAADDAASGADDAIPAPGTVWRIASGDVVSCAPELARLSLNVAGAHHDTARGAGGRRLVYGGHTIGLAAAQATRALPELLTIVAWHGCDHTAPVHEGDTLTSALELERSEPAPGFGGVTLLHLRSRVHARKADGTDGGQVLDWRFAAAAVA